MGMAKREKAIRGSINRVREGMGKNRWRGKGVKRWNNVCNGWPDSLAGMGKGDERERGNADERGAWPVWGCCGSRLV